MSLSQYQASHRNLLLMRLQIPPLSRVELLKLPLSHPSSCNICTYSKSSPCVMPSAAPSIATIPPRLLAGVKGRLGFGCGSVAIKKDRCFGQAWQISPCRAPLTCQLQLSSVLSFPSPMQIQSALVCLSLCTRPYIVRAFSAQRYVPNVSAGYF